MRDGAMERFNSRLATCQEVKRGVRDYRSCDGDGMATTTMIMLMMMMMVERIEGKEKELRRDGWSK